MDLLSLGVLLVVIVVVVLLIIYQTLTNVRITYVGTFKRSSYDMKPLGTSNDMNTLLEKIKQNKPRYVGFSSNGISGPIISMFSNDLPPLKRDEIGEGRVEQKLVRFAGRDRMIKISNSDFSVYKMSYPLLSGAMGW